MRKPLVLVVDDNPDVRELYVEYLGIYGYRTREAVDGLDALAQADAEQADVVLMDLAMPRMDGADATRALRARPAYARVPIIGVTGQGAEGVAAMRRAGCDATCTKPCEPDGLRARIEALLASKSSGGAARE